MGIYRNAIADRFTGNLFRWVAEHDGQRVYCDTR